MADQNYTVVISNKPSSVSVIPQYELGVGTYGVPIVHDWDEGTTLHIGTYCSIARNVQIFLGG